MSSQRWTLIAFPAIATMLADPAFAGRMPHPTRPVVTAVSERPSRARTGEGRVLFVTEKRAYLDHGADGGLVAGQEVTLSRGGRAIGNCTVETTAAHSAACSGGRARPGDTFRLGRDAKAKVVIERKPVLVVDEQRLRSDNQAIATSEIHRVDFTGKPRFGNRTGLMLTGGFASWQTGSDPQTQFRQERIDASLRLPFGDTGVRFDAAFTALRWQPRPDTARFRPDQPTEFYLWEAEVSHRDGDARTVAAVGRIWPWHTPGLSMLDGLQVGRRSEDRSDEVGVYAGLLPYPLSLAPATDAWTGGLYASSTYAGRKTATLGLARADARLGMRRAPRTGVVGEGELLGQTWIGWWILSGGARAIVVPSVQGTPAVDRAFVDVRARPTGTADGGITVRYVGPSLEAQELLLRTITPSLQGRTHAAADARWDFMSWLGVGIRGDLARDGSSGFVETSAAVELRLPRLFGEFGGLWLGGEAAEGWLRTRAAYAQALGQIRGRLRVVARVSAITSEYQQPSANLDGQELDGFLQLDAPVTRYLRLRGRALVRSMMAQQTAGPGPGVLFDVDATGVF